ncbi:MAG: ABC-F family ATP-binding cassette domain-containing protein, partial [Eubacteriales bacterium]|nr:ABC-F family ATP-binding cassette domain-containing protein [Eubacteriales bacterium]
MAAVDVSELHKYYGTNHVLKGISFQVYNNEKIGLLGSNGAGKTTLFKVMAGTLPYEGGTAAIPSALKIGLLEQIPEYPSGFTGRDVLETAFSAIFSMKAELRELSMQLEANPGTKREVQILKRYGEVQSAFETAGGYVTAVTEARICNGLGISKEMLDNPFRLLSGGEKTRINLGRIILEQPDMLLLDEPTNHLDMESVEWLEEYIREFRGTVIAISHDRYFLDRTVSRIIEIVDGTAEFYEGNYSYYVKEKESRRIQKLEAYEQEQKKVRQLEAAARRMHDWARGSDNPALHKRAFAIEKRIERLETAEKPVKKRNISTGFKGTRFRGNDAVVIKNLYKSYGDIRIAEGLHLAVTKDERVALIGCNGCGKTSLIRMIAGLEDPDSGYIKTGEGVKAGILHQNVVFEKPQYTVLDTVRHELILSEEAARNRLAAYNFRADDVLKRVEVLSGGEKSRLKLCILMQHDINMLILDEPTNHLDIESREWIEKAISGFTGTLIFVSHDRYFIGRFATRICEMSGGRITDFRGTYDEYRQYRMKTIVAFNSASGIAPGNEPNKVSSTVSDKSSGSAAGYRNNRSRSLSTKASEIEKSIEDLEESMKQLCAEEEKNQSDYEKLQSLMEEKGRIAGEIEAL